MERITSKSRVKVNVITPNGGYRQVSDSFKLNEPESRNPNGFKDTINTGVTSTIKKGSATPNIITTNPATYRTNG